MASVRVPAAVRRAAVGGIVGPLVFVCTWVGASAVHAHYSALHDPISDLAAVHSSTRVAMTTAFLVFAVGLVAYAWALRALRFGPAWITAAATGCATAAVAAFPLHHSATVDRIHGVCAGTGYVTLAATALLMGVRLRRLGEHGWARFALTAGVVSALALALTLVGSYEGLFQRVGLTAGDAWIVAGALAIRAGWFAKSDSAHVRATS